LPQRRLLGHWEVKRSADASHRLEVASRPVSLSSTAEVKVHYGPLDRMEARGAGFSEMHSFVQLPFHETAVAADACVTRDQHNRQLYDSVHVCTSNPGLLFTFKPAEDEFSRVSVNHLLPRQRWQSAIPRLRLLPFGREHERFPNIVAVHDEVSNAFLMVDPKNGTVLNLEWYGLLDQLKDQLAKITTPVNAKQQHPPFFRMVTNPSMLAKDRVLFFTPGSEGIEMLDLNANEPSAHSARLPFKIKSAHPLGASKILLSGEEGLFLMDGEGESLPSQIKPISQDAGVKEILKVANDGLSDFGLKIALGETVSSPNTLMVAGGAHAAVAVGFPDLEFSKSEVHAWPAEDGDRGSNVSDGKYSNQSTYAAVQRYADPSRNYVFLRNSCQVVRPLPAKDVDAKYSKNNYGLANPGFIEHYLEVTDLMAGKLRYVPVPETRHQSPYSMWYKQTYPDQSLVLAEMSDEGLVSVDNGGCVRLWETGVANLERSYNEWQRMLGEQHAQLTIERNKAGDLNSPKHGKVDPTGAPHVGGATWAGGTGGRDTAGLGGYGGPYRLDAGHDVHQLSDEVKAQVPEHIRKAAREMNRKAFEERLREIKMSQYDAELYEK